MKYNEWFDKMERILSTLMILLLCLVIVYNSSVIYRRRQMIVGSSDRGEGMSLYQQISPKGTVTIAIDGNNIYPELEVLINGEFFKKFGNHSLLTLEVQDRQVIQINGSMYKEEIKIRVVSTSGNVKRIILNSETVVKGNIQTLSIIKI